MATRTQANGLTFDTLTAETAEIAVLGLPSFGGSSFGARAAKIVRDGRTVAIVLDPSDRHHRAYGGWGRDTEYRFQERLRQLAAQFGGTAVLAYDPL